MLGVLGTGVGAVSVCELVATVTPYDVKTAGEKVTGGTGELVLSAEDRIVRALGGGLAWDKTVRAFVDADGGDEGSDGEDIRRLVPVLGGVDNAAVGHVPSPAVQSGVTVTNTGFSDVSHATFTTPSLVV